MKYYSKSSKHTRISLILFSFLLFFFISCSETPEADIDPDKKECPTNCETWQECNSNYECSLKTGFCETITDCIDDKICDDQHLCIEKEIEDKFCEEDTCKEWETCDDANKTSPPKCELITGKCTSNDDCDSGLTCNAENFCANTDFTHTTIQNLQQDDSFMGKTVETTGFVTAIALSQQRSPKGLYIQFSEEKHSGIYVYFIAAGVTTIKVGDLVKVKGILDNPESAKRIRTKISDIEIIKSGEMPYEPVEIDYFTALNNYESMLISVNTDRVRFNLRELLPQHFVFENEERSKLYVKDTISWLNHLALGIKIENLTGILENFDDLARVLPRSEDDIRVYMPVCETACFEWEECLDRDVCVISAGRCVESTDCKNENSSCDSDNYCQEPSLLDNGDIDDWDLGKPVGYLIGSALSVYMEDNKKEASLYGAKVERVDFLEDGTETVEFLSPPVSVDYNKNYDLSLYILDNHTGIDAKIYYKAYNYSDTVIGSGIAGDNDFTSNVDNWIELKYTTGFISKGEIWYGLPENLSYIRFGVRLYKDHCVDNTCDAINSTGNGFVYIDSLSIIEKL